MAKKLLSIVLLLLLLTSCSQNTVQEYIRDDVIYQKPTETKSDFYYIDTTQKDLGYVIFYMPANWYIIMNKLDSDFEQTIYSMKDETDSYKIALSYGNGTYEFEIFDSSMNSIHTENITIENVLDETLYTMSNSIIDFSSSDLVSIIASEAYMKAPTDKDYLNIMNRYVYRHIKYDVDRRDLDMFVTVDNILTRGYGVCYEKAKLFTALARVKNIPCKLVFGDYKNSYHAWCEVFVDSQWSIYDPTDDRITSIDNKSYTNRIKIY